MNQNDPTRTTTRRRWRSIAPPLLLGVLALLVIGRMVTDDDGRPGTASSSRTHAPAHEAGRAGPASGAALDELPFEPAAIELPASWELVERRSGVATWRAPGGDDAVSVAAVEAAATPLAAIVADVARRARTTGPDTHVDAPRDLRGLTTARRDSVMQLSLRTRVDGRELFVRQVWRRDSRAGRDIVATWTSSDDAWDVDPATIVPTLDLR